MPRLAHTHTGEKCKSYQQAWVSSLHSGIWREACTQDLTPAASSISHIFGLGWLVFVTFNGVQSIQNVKFPVLTSFKCAHSSVTQSTPPSCTTLATIPLQALSCKTETLPTKPNSPASSNHQALSVSMCLTILSLSFRQNYRSYPFVNG